MSAQERKFIIIGTPRSKQQIQTGNGKVFQSKNYVAWHKAAKAQLTEQMRGNAPMQGDLAVVIDLHHRRPVGKSKSRPGLLDWDNLAKAVCDPANGVLWVDDKQIMSGAVHRRWSDEGHTYVTIRVTEFEPL